MSGDFSIVNGISRFDPTYNLVLFLFTDDLDYARNISEP